MPKECFVNVVQHLPPEKQWDLALAAVERVKECGMVGEQISRATGILARGHLLLTWRRSDGGYHFCGLPPFTGGAA